MDCNSGRNLKPLVYHPICDFNHLAWQLLEYQCCAYRKPPETLAGTAKVAIDSQGPSLITGG